MTGTYLLANIPVRISSLFGKVHEMCAPYATDREQELSISTSIEEIEEMRAEAREEADKRAEMHSQPYLETLLVYKKLVMMIVGRDVLLIHGSALSVHGQGVLFTAVSGTGKSTHSNLWRKLLGDDVMMVNDDKPLIWVGGRKQEAPIIYGTPWDGKHHLSNNIAVPLKAIVYLQRSNRNRIEEVKGTDLIAILWQQTFHTADPTLSMKVLILLSQLVTKVHFYRLYCNMEKEAAQVAYETIFPNG